MMLLELRQSGILDDRIYNATIAQNGIFLSNYLYLKNYLSIK